MAQAGEAIRLRDEFLSIASHELKTPLTAVQLQLKILNDRLPSIDQKLADGIDRARRLAGRFGQLVEALLDVSRIAAGTLTLTLESFDIGEVAREIGERLRDSARAARCELSVEADLSRIFERFERAASGHNYGGMGLGLYVARQIVEAHGGTIVARNLPRGGACFTVRLPLASRAPAPASRTTKS